MENKKKTGFKLKPSCETCEYFDYVDDLGDNACTVDMDEDDIYRLSENKAAHCPFYKYYDEYKSVHKQI